jgi:hypothetical protein|tara:strand:- start:840 stop:1010 length:171 start_codon:yes stop_codon:yes gene_type:complete
VSESWRKKQIHCAAMDLNCANAVMTQKDFSPFCYLRHTPLTQKDDAKIKSPAAQWI